MKKTVKNLILVLTLIFSLSFGTVCYAAEETTPQVYYNGKTIADYALTATIAAEATKNSDNWENYTYSVFTTSNAVVIIGNGIYDGCAAANVTSYVFDVTNKIATVTVTSIVGPLNYSQSNTYDITIEVK